MSEAERPTSRTYSVSHDDKSVMRRLLNKSWVYKTYKALQRFSVIYYGKFVLSLVLILSVLSKTFFSLGYIIVLCIFYFPIKSPPKGA